MCINQWNKLSNLVISFTLILYICAITAKFHCIVCFGCEHTDINFRCALIGTHQFSVSRTLTCPAIIFCICTITTGHETKFNNAYIQSCKTLFVVLAKADSTK